MVVVPRVSGSTVPTPGGGGGAGRPSTFANTKLPRGIGEVVVPFHTDSDAPRPDGSDVLCDDGECARVVIEARGLSSAVMA